MSDPLLPITQRRAEIEGAIRTHQVVIVCGETGSGKTTQLPQICRDMGLAERGVIGHTQPRRLAARAVAARIAEEMGVRLGVEVGVKVRFEDRTSRATRIKLMTDGMLLAELASDPELSDYSVIILDEAHERSLNVDFLIGCLRTLLVRRRDLRLVVTSATIDPLRFSLAFGGPNAAPVIEVSGRTYPVEIRYRPDRDDEDDPARVSPERVADAVEELARPSLPRGDILVFLPGEREITACADAVRRRGARVEVLPLFARLSSAEQDRIFHPSPDGARRVVLATNIAETSLTVPGIRYVVDTGVARLNRYDPERKVQRLPVEPISRASANQRSGRCGRVAEGVCIRLYSEESFAARPAFTEPEIRRTSLAGVALQMKAMGLGEIAGFPFLDPPEPRAAADAYETLFELGAIDAPGPGGRLTDIGSGMARLPLDPRVARMLLAAKDEGAAREVVVLAAALSIQDPRERPLGRQDEADRAQLVFRDETSDFLTLLNLWEQFEHALRTSGAGDLREWCRRRFVSHTRLREWAETARQIRDVAEEMELLLPAASPPAAPDRVHRALLTGLISNVACREGDAGSFLYRGVRGNEVSIFPGSALFKKAPRWIMAAEIVHTNRLYARTVAKIELEWIEQLAGHVLQRRLADPHLDAESGRPSVWERVTMSGIVVVPRRRADLARLDRAAARRIFILDGLARLLWKSDASFMLHNRAVLDRAGQLEAMVRKRGLTRPPEEIAAWFDERLPAEVHDPATLSHWLATAERDDPGVLRLPLAAALRQEALGALDDSLFPRTLDLGAAGTPELQYDLAPGKDEDGITATLSLAQLAALTPERAAWLVPGRLPDLLAALLKTLPRAARASVEAHGTPDEIGAQCAGVVDFGRTSPPAALAEALDVMYSVRVKAEEFSPRALPAHLVLRVRVVDENGREIGVDRDLGALKERFEGRIRRAAAQRARTAFERPMLTTWDFPELADAVAIERDGVISEMYPALVDERLHVRLTLLSSRTEAAIVTERGVRRLFALACAGEQEHRFSTMPEWSDMCRNYQQLGSAAQLLDEAICLVAWRTFMAARPTPRTREEFDSRLQESWGRLAVLTREVVEVLSRLLEGRARVAQRLSGGTPRLWADSVADIREHAAYLMPVGFLGSVGWDHLRHYPRYVEAMRERLFGLREGGSGSEKAALQQFAPYWKRFTGWVAAAMAAARSEAEPPEVPVAAPARKGKAPLPQTRRNSPVVNVDAGVWAITAGNLTPEMERYRWALEEMRVALFVPTLASKPVVTPNDLDALWKKVSPLSR